MKKDEKAFIKFTNFEKCSNKEFNLAFNYSKNANILDKGRFINAITIIIKTCIVSLKIDNYCNFNVAREIYTEHGLSDDNFKDYFIEIFGEIKYIEFLSKFTENMEFYLQEYLFNKAKAILWESDKLNKLARELKITNDFLIANIKDYAFNVLKFDKSKFTHYKKIYKAFVAFLDNKNYKFELVLEYYNKYGTNEEKVAFNNHVKSIILESLKCRTSKENLFNYLNSLNLNVHNLLELLSIYKNDKLENILFNTFKDFYEYADSVSFHRPTLIDKAKEYNMTYDEYMYVVKLYATKILNIKDINEIIRSKNTKAIPDAFKYSDVLFEILHETDKDRVYKLFYDNSIVKDIIIRFCYSKSRNFTDEQRRAYEKNLMIKYNYYQKTRKRKEYFLLPHEIVIDYLNSPLTFQDFCKANNIYQGFLTRTINQLEDQDLLLKVKSKIASEFVPTTINTEERIKLLLSCINNGIIINNCYKEFDLIDFCILFKDINYYREFYPYITPQERIMLTNFLHPLKTDAYINRETLVNSYFEIQIDENTKRIITKDEIISIVEFMDNNKIPMINTLFNIALKRYLTSNLDIYKPEEPTLQ